MSDRVSQKILLCEDEAQERLTKKYLKRCRLPFRPPQLKSVVASREQQGGNDNWVLNRFPDELHACRRRHTKAKSLLIVLIDADEMEVDGRRRELLARIEAAGFDGFGSDEPCVLLIPKRHIET